MAVGIDAAVPDFEERARRGVDTLDIAEKRLAEDRFLVLSKQGNKMTMNNSALKLPLPALLNSLLIRSKRFLNNSLLGWRL